MSRVLNYDAPRCWTVFAPMSADDDDDYLSDKFLLESSTASTSSKPTTYSQLRKEAHKKSQLKNEQNRTKSRRQREVEAREEALSKSLFERAKEEEAAGIGSGNKALSIMMKMGFKPGQSLGNADPLDEPAESRPEDSTGSLSPAPAALAGAAGAGSESKGPDERTSSPLPGADSEGQQQHVTTTTTTTTTHTKHKTEPLPLHEWAGRYRCWLIFNPSRHR